MTRLTKHVREAMTRDLLDRRFKPQGLALVERSKALFVTIYDSRYNADTKGLMRKLKAKFHDAFQHYGTIETRAPGGIKISVGNANFGYGVVTFRGNVEHRPFLNGDRTAERWTFTDCEIGQQLSDLANDQLAFVNSIKTAERELLSALGSITTAKQLYEVWPEATDILNRHMPVASNTSSLPAIQFAKLTDAFGLAAAA
jgi:hypothetical protein